MWDEGSVLTRVDKRNHIIIYPLSLAHGSLFERHDLSVRACPFSYARTTLVETCNLVVRQLNEEEEILKKKKKYLLHSIERLFASLTQ